MDAPRVNPLMKFVDPKTHQLADNDKSTTDIDVAPEIVDKFLDSSLIDQAEFVSALEADSRVGLLFGMHRVQNDPRKEDKALAIDRAYYLIKMRIMRCDSPPATKLSLEGDAIVSRRNDTGEIGATLKLSSNFAKTMTLVKLSDTVLVAARADGESVSMKNNEDRASRLYFQSCSEGWSVRGGLVILQAPVATTPDQVIKGLENVAGKRPFFSTEVSK